MTSDKGAGRKHVFYGERPMQPYVYPPKREFAEPDWTRWPGWKDVTKDEWESALWQRKHSVKNLRELAAVWGDKAPEGLLEDIDKDAQINGTMSMLIPPQMINCMNENDLWNDPVRRYMIPAFDDRHHEWPSHPKAERDSLHEADMWAVEGLTHRYPTKVLAELLATCPQYCGHCTRMDLVGNDTPNITKYRFAMKQQERWDAMLDYLRRTPTVRDVVVSGGDIANLPPAQLEAFMMQLLDIPNIRDVRLATKALQALPQHFLQDEVLAALERICRRAHERGVEIAVHTHVNHASQVTPLFAKAVRKILDMGYRDVRNQGVLLRGVNSDSHDMLDLCFMLLDCAKVMPYYFYMCDMIPNSEHWRLSVREAQRLQHDIMGYLPGFATPRVVCDVPFVGKRWVHQLVDYDKVRGISYWTKNYKTVVDMDDADALEKRYTFYDPVYTLPEDGQHYWREYMKQNSGK